MGPRPRLFHPPQKIVRPFFLLEIVIAIGLASILLSLLFRFLVSYAIIEKKIEGAQIVLLERERVQEKLESIFTSIEPAGMEGPSFYTLQFPDEKSASLVLLYNAGVDPNPAFSGPNTGRLYLSERGEFCLTQWPLAKDDHRTEVLLRDVTALEWEMLGPNQQNRWTWLPLWPKQQGGVPSIIRLKLWCGIDKKKKREPNLQFAFIRPTQEPIQILR